MTDSSLEEKKKNLAKLIRDELNSLNINQTQLAMRVDVAPTTISAWLKGTQFPDESNRRKIAMGLGYTLERLESVINGQPFITEPTIDKQTVIDFLKFCKREEFSEIWEEVIATRVAKELASKS